MARQLTRPSAPLLSAPTIVLPVRADVPDIDDPIGIINPNHDAILVAGDVEHGTPLKRPDKS